MDLNHTFQNACIYGLVGRKWSWKDYSLNIPSNYDKNYTGVISIDRKRWIRLIILMLVAYANGSTKFLMSWRYMKISFDCFKQKDKNKRHLIKSRGFRWVGLGMRTILLLNFQKAIMQRLKYRLCNDTRRKILFLMNIFRTWSRP